MRALAIPVFQPQLLQVDVAGGGVVGTRLQNGPVAPQIHQTCRPEKEQRGTVTETCRVGKVLPKS